MAHPTDKQIAEKNNNKNEKNAHPVINSYLYGYLSDWAGPYQPNQGSEWTNMAAIPIGESSTLSFWHRYQFEGSSYDGSVLEISTDGGSNWSDLGVYITANGYNGTISSSYSNPLGGRQGWVGDLTSWTQVSVDLDSFAGEEVMFRWRLGCDSSVGDTGWYIDDVLVTAPLPPVPEPVLSAITPDSGWNGEPTPVVIK